MPGWSFLGPQLRLSKRSRKRSGASFRMSDGARWHHRSSYPSPLRLNEPEEPMRNANVIPSLFLDFMQMQEFAKDPLIFTEARGSRLITADGREFIDGLSGVFVTSLGQGNQAVITAMTEQLKRLSFAPPLHGTTPPAP